MDPILAPASLPQLDPSLLVLLDCRAGPGARAKYEAGHLKGAHFVDLERDLATATETPERGGRHPLPAVAQFAAFVGRLGITPESHVVVYDDQGGANAAARMWWMLRALGHGKVQLLDVGLSAAEAENLELTTEVPSAHGKPPYPTLGYGLPMADIDEVERTRSEADHCVLDVRAAGRYRGEHEPIDPVAGRIPGARNLPFAENLHEGRFRSAKELRTLYQSVLGSVSPENLIVHCGSGVTACHTLIALERAGLAGARLYVGSWSEWCRDPKRAREP